MALDSSWYHFSTRFEYTCYSNGLIPTTLFSNHSNPNNFPSLKK